MAQDPFVRHMNMLKLQLLDLKKENARLREERDHWMKLCMEGEKTREKTLLGAILGAFSKG